MKNLKVVLTLLPVLALTFFIYFTTIGFSSENVVKEDLIPEVKIEGTSDLCMFTFTLTSDDINCTGPYTFCVNGGELQTTNLNPFNYKLECGGTYTICVMGSNGCSGTTTVTVPCPCRTSNPRTIQLSTGGPTCICANS